MKPGDKVVCIKSCEFTKAGTRGTIGGAGGYVVLEHGTTCGHVANWRLIIFEEGDLVKCVKNNAYNKDGGAGWEEDMVYTIDRVDFLEQGERAVAFPKGGNGVYFSHLKHADALQEGNLERKEGKTMVNKVKIFVRKNLDKDIKVLLRNGIVDDCLEPAKTDEAIQFLNAFLIEKHKAELAEILLEQEKEDKEAKKS